MGKLIVLAVKEMTRDWDENEVDFKRERELGSWNKLEEWTNISV